MGKKIEKDILEEALDEASKLKEKIKTGEAKNYDDAEKIVDQDNSSIPDKQDVSGTTKEDIYQKLEVLKNKATKINYLKSLEPRIDLVKPETRQAFYEALAELYEKEEDFKNAAEYFAKAGEEEKAKEVWIKAGDNALKKGQFSKAAEYFAKAGEEEKAKEAWLKEGDAYYNNERNARECYQKAGLLDENKINRRLGDSKFAHEEFKNAAEYFAKAGEEEKAKEAWIKAGDNALKKGQFSKAAEYFAKAGEEEKEKEMREKEVNIFLNILRRDNRLNSSIDEFKKAIDKLDSGKAASLEVADICASKTSFAIAAKYYKLAGEEEKAKEMWIKKADEYIGMSKDLDYNCEEAAECYQEAGLEEKEAWLKIADKLLEKSRRDNNPERFFLAAKYYAEAGAEKEGLIKVVDKASEYECLEDALEYAQKLGDKRILIKVGDVALEKRNYNNIKYAIEAYEAAGDKRNLIKLGNVALKEGYFESAEEAFEKVGLGKEGLIKIGDVAFEQGCLYRVVEYYKKAEIDKSEDVERLSRLAKAYDKIEEGKKAMLIHKKIKRLSVNMVREKIINETEDKKGNVQQDIVTSSDKRDVSGMTKEDIYKKAELYEKEEEFEEAAEYFAKAGEEEKAKEAWIKAGDWYLGRGLDWVDEALEFYERAESGKEGLIKVADKALEKDKLELATEYYEKVGDKKGLIRIIDKALKIGNFNTAKECYEKVISLGESMENLSEQKKIIDKISQFYKKPATQEELIENIRKLKEIPDDKNEAKVIIKLDATGRANKFIYMQDENGQEYIIAIPTSKKAFHANVVELFEKIYKKKFKDITGGHVHTEKDKLIFGGSSGKYGKFPLEKVREIVRKAFPDIEVETR